jgi:hypothetical protein
MNWRRVKDVVASFHIPFWSSFFSGWNRGDPPECWVRLPNFRNMTPPPPTQGTKQECWPRTSISIAVRSFCTKCWRNHGSKCGNRWIWDSEISWHFLIAVRMGGPGSSVGITTELRAGRSRDRIPVGRRAFPPVQTSLGAHPVSCKMGIGSFPRVKCGQGVTLTTHPLLKPRSWKSRAIPLPPSGPQPGLKRGYFTFTFTVTMGNGSKQALGSDARH